MQLYLIRHAQSANNELYARTESSNGRSPDPLLTETGHQQARQLAQFLAKPEPVDLDPKQNHYNQHGFRLTHLYCSLQQRAILTASYIAEALNLPLVADADIHEWGGVFVKDETTGERIGLPGPSRAFFALNYPPLILPESVGEDGWWNRRAENVGESFARAERVWQALWARHGANGDRVAMVIHGGFYYSLMGVLLNAQQKSTLFGDEIREVHMRTLNTGVTRLDFVETAVGPRVIIMYTNRADFLPVDLITN